MFTLKNLLALDQKPAPYEQGDEFWNDPYISGQLLETHLDGTTDLASYKPETMDAICRYLPEAMGLNAGAAIVDLGCGPGLYCARLSEAGYAMTGVDRCEHSLAYAKEHAPKARFLRQSYVEPFGENKFDAAIMISQDYGVLSPDDRQTLLDNIHTALRPGGYFAFDMPSLRAFAERTAKNAPNWYAAGAGFYRPHAHFVLEKRVAYPEIPALCDAITVLDDKITTCKFWQTFFSPETIGAELEHRGFRVAEALADLAGTPYKETSPALGIIAVKA